MNENDIVSKSLVVAMSDGDLHSIVGKKKWRQKKREN